MPLIGHDSVVQHAAQDTQDICVEEKFRSEARRVEGHGDAMAIRATIGRIAMSCKILQNRRPKSVAGGFDDVAGEVLSEDAEAAFLDLADLVSHLASQSDTSDR